jgi:hypothetical protein
MLSLKFPVTMATRGHLKIAKNHYFALIFSSKLISKCCHFSLHRDRVKGFSALVTRYLMIDLWSFLASHKSKIFLAMRRTPPPFKPPKQKGAHPPTGNPPDWMGDGAEKVLNFLNNFSRTKTSVWGPK